ncbi:MBL fold metallo-hydrolase [Pleomorphovibrio marinus]|uniref:MBL fold metallo-hydrolase n=1 Tax=Pleomorphovibrio marinus TaxID=2164132 RepID=UPI000E0CAD7C|nr:MBL fold metallo-hydrolase [Pleomorphovibrio marinus]
MKLLDLEFLEAKQVIGSYLIPGEDGNILVETGPETTWTHMVQALKEEGIGLKDIKHVLLTHIHFDHAGAAWKFAEAGAKIYVHPVGLPHLASPEKLWNSASKIYGEDMDRLWGKMAPIAKDKLEGVEHGQTLKVSGQEFRCWHTPGHAVHHIAWQWGDTLFTGDVAGVRISDGPVVPPCPPPDINLADWSNSLQLIREIAPQTLCLTHFGQVTEIEPHLKSLEKMMEDWALWMKRHFDQGTPMEEVTQSFMVYTELQMKEMGVAKELRQCYEYANPSWMSVAGLMRYWRLKEEGRI